MSQDKANVSEEIKAQDADLTQPPTDKAKRLDIEEGEVSSQDPTQAKLKDLAQAANGSEEAGKDKSRESMEVVDNGDQDKSKKKKKDKSKKKDKDKKSEKKADKKEKRSSSRDKKTSKRNKEKSASKSRSRSPKDSRRKKRSKSRSKDTRRKRDKSSSRSKRRSTSRSKRRSSSRQKDRRQDKHRDVKDSRERNRDTRRRSKSPVRREKSSERVPDSDSRRKKEERESTRDKAKSSTTRESRGNKKMEVVEDEPLDEESQKKIESALAIAEEDEEAIAARARERRKTMLEEARKAKEEEERVVMEALALEEAERLQAEKAEEKVIEKQVKEKPVRSKAEKFVKELAEKTEAEKTKEAAVDKGAALGETENVEQGKMQEEKKDDEELSPLKKHNPNHKHDVDKEKYIKMIESMREKLQQEEEDLRENGDKEEDELNKGEEEEKKNEDEFDMFCETPESILAENPSAPIVGADNAAYDDENGYYRAQIGEIVNGRYKILGKLGKGVFGNVFRATDTQTNLDVAMKVVKSEEIYLMSGLKEKEILNMLNEADRHNKRHVVRLLDSFEYRRHLVLIFEIMEMDLRNAIKTFGKKLGLSIESVRSYARQLLIALSHLRKHKIIHADLKPDNILVTNNQKTLKLSDFGSAFPVEENTITPYLVARYYRAPEIILGCPYDTAVDMWSAACTIFELYTGKMLFPGRDNNEMLKLIMQTKGKFNNKMLKRGEFSSQYFDHQNNFLSTEIDPVTRMKYVKPIPIGGKITRDIGQLLNAVEIELTDEDKKKVTQLKDLLERCLTLDANKRISPDEALSHIFINYNVQKPATGQSTLKHAF